jgi:hypothetical protein
MSVSGREREETVPKLTIIGLVAVVLALPISASAGQQRHRHACSSLSEMVACGKQGVRGNRAQFVAALTRPVKDEAFLSRLAH